MASYDEAVPPGQVGKLVATLDTSKLRGTVTRSIDLKTNDPVRPLVRLTLKADVLGSVDVLPQDHARLSNRLPALSRTRLVLRKDRTEEGELTVASLEVSQPWLSARPSRVDELIPAGGGMPTVRPGDWLLDVELVDQAPRGRSEAEIRFKTGLQREPTFAIPVLVDFQPVVQLSADAVVLNGPDHASPEGTVLVAVRRGLDAERLEVTAEPHDLELELEPAGARQFKLHLRWPGAHSSASGEVTFRLDEERFRVPVSISPSR